MIKFNLSYQLTMTPNDYLVNSPSPVTFAPITVNFPTTLDIDVDHTIEAQANVCDISVYGLGLAHRRKTLYNQQRLPGLFPIALHAGYVSESVSGINTPNSALPLIFSGYARYGFTERVRSDLVTRINAMDSGNTQSDDYPAFIGGSPDNNYSAPVGTAFPDICRSIMGFLAPNVTVGNVLIETPLMPPAVQGKPRVFAGDAWGVLRDLAYEAGSKLFIENGNCSILSQNSIVPSIGPSLTVSADTGLLDVPKYEGYNLKCSMIFEPRFRIGTMVKVQSEVTPWIAGNYKVNQYAHHGRISGVDASGLITDVTLEKLNPPYFPI